VALEALLILVVLNVGNAPIPGGDGPEYDQLARNLIFHGVFSSASSPPLLPNITRAPGYPALLAIFDYVDVRPVLMVRIAQFGMVALTARLIYDIARQVSDQWTARVAAFFTATYLPLLGLASYHLTEITACLLTALATLLLIRVTRRAPGSLMSVAGLGLTLAALAYVRPEFSLFAAIVAVGVLLSGEGSFRSRERWVRPLIIGAVFAVAVAPWTIRNAALTGRLIPLAAGTGVSLLASADQYAGTVSDGFTASDFHTYLQQVAAISSSVHVQPGPRRDVAADDAYTREAKRIFDHVSLAKILTSFPEREAYLWQPADFAPQKLHTLISRLALAQYVALLALILIGVWATRRSFLRDWPLWVLALYVSLLHLVFHVEGRYTVPARPALMVFAALGAVGLGRALRRPSARSIAST
jgi:4-amino-4-deoxy-L-arabinose transferase-like glycosyltransferase